MTLEKGTRLGPYEILSAIGAGGMGEVYLAMDTRLNRRVAIKVLPPQWSSNPDMKARFDREAKIIAGLNHPHICTLHDIGHQDDTDYLVMEYIEGETLADRITKGPLPVDEGTRIAIEIAGALDRAHREGITHRDLKPGNVMLTKSGVKLLDFGLAKQAAAVKTQAVSESLLATRADVTVAGAIVGTMQYMAPEQLEGKNVTAQTDIFAFGAVLYEMLTGRKAFASESQAGLISAIMTSSPPPISTIQNLELPGLDYAVKKSLEKDPANRWQSARDLMDHLQWSSQKTAVFVPPVAITTPSRKPRGMAIPKISAIAAALVLTWMAVRYFQKAPAPAEIRFEFEGDVAGTNFSVSPDGHWIAYAGRTPGSDTRFLFLRSMDSTAAQQIAGTENALGPFWSPDSKRLGFFTQTTLKTVAIPGGMPETLCEAPGANRTGTWGKGDVIIFSSTEVLNRVSAAGGKPEALTALNLSHAETAHIFPTFLPDGRHFLYSALSQQTADRALYAGTVDSKETTRLLSLTTAAIYSSGKLLYVDNGALVARDFDADKLTFKGEPTRIAGQAAAAFSASDSVIIYRKAPPAASRTFQYSWVDANGKPLGMVGKPETYLPYWDLSPDGKQAAVGLLEGEPAAARVVVIDLERGISSRITTGTETGAAPRWSGDGLRVAYVTQQKGNRDIFAKNASGLGAAEELVNSSEPETLDDWSPDGRYILYRTGANTNTIFALPLFGDRKPLKIVESEINKAKTHVSADGKWIAYEAIEAGMSQIYVVSFPKADQKRQISTKGGVQPHWRPDGKGLYFLGPDGKLMSVDVTTEPSLSSGTPTPLFDSGIANPSFDSEEYATADGKRFLFLKYIPASTAAPASSPLTVIVNWTAALKNSKP